MEGRIERVVVLDSREFPRRSGIQSPTRIGIPALLCVSVFRAAIAHHHHRVDPRLVRPPISCHISSVI
jgi:hypothetical protein